MRPVKTSRVASAYSKDIMLANQTNRDQVESKSPIYTFAGMHDGIQLASWAAYDSATFQGILSLRRPYADLQNATQSSFQLAL